MTRFYPALACVATCASVCLTDTSAAQLEPGEPTDAFEQSTWLDLISEPTDIAFLSDGRGVITGKGGHIWVTLPDGRILHENRSLLAVDTYSEKGLLGVVVDDQDTLYLYASTGDLDEDKHRVHTATVDAAGVVSVDTSRNLIGSGLEGPANHDGGGMVIHDGQLYVGVGDTGFNASPPTNRYGTCLNKPNGKILRVNLDGSIPSDNPLVGMAMVTGCASPGDTLGMFPPDERIYAWGLRNPWRFYVDPATSLLWIGDVGEITQEEITVGGKGVHHGWPFREGTVVHGGLDALADCQDVVPSTACVPPQHGYPRGDGVSVTGGLIPPAGCGWGAYEQRYFFGDYGVGRVWTIDVTPDRRGVVAGSRRDFASIDANVSFRMGPDGAMYVVGRAIFRIAPKSLTATCDLGATAAPVPFDGGPGAAGAGEGCGCELSAQRPHGPLHAVLGVALVLGARAVRARQRHRAG